MTPVLRVPPTSPHTRPELTNAPLLRMENGNIHSYIQEYGWLTAAPGRLKAALHSHTTYTCMFEAFYLDRSLIGSFTTKLTERLHSQIRLPGASEQDFVPSPAVCALENFEGIKEWESTDIKQSSKQSSPKAHSTERLLLSCKHSWPQRCLFISHHVHPQDLQSWCDPGNSQLQLSVILLFCSLL